MSGEREGGLKGLESQVPRAGPLGAPAFGHLRGSFGSFRQLQLEPSTPRARYPPPHAFSGHGPFRDVASHPSPLISGFFPTCSSNPFPSSLSQSPATPELPGPRRATRRAMRGARDAVTRGAVTRSTRVHLSLGAPPSAGPARQRARGPPRAGVSLASRLAATASSAASRVLAGTSTRSVSWLAGAHAPVRTRGRGEQHDPRRGRCGRAGAPGPRPRQRLSASGPAEKGSGVRGGGGGGGGAASSPERAVGGARRRRRRWR